MTNETSPRRRFPVRARLLSVTVVAVAASLVVWHAQVAEFLGVGAGDTQPVIAYEAQPGALPPPGVGSTTVEPTPTREPVSTPVRRPTKSATTPTPRTTSYDESSTEGLSPTLRGRLAKAMAAAEADGVTLTITSGRRSAAKQRKLLQEAIEKYGSYRKATRWVLPPEYSAHVQGKAVDIGPAAGMAWLDRNGWRYGICRRYDNEPWHFEALTRPGRKCPPREPYAVAQN